MFEYFLSFFNLDTNEGNTENVQSELPLVEFTNMCNDEISKEGLENYTLKIIDKDEYKKQMNE